MVVGGGSVAGLNVGGLPTGTVNAATLAASSVTAAKIGYSGAILQITANNDTTTGSTTNADWAGMWSHYITRISTSNKVLIQASLFWCSTNPNGIWYLERSFDNSTFTRIIRLHQADECKGAGSDMETFSVNYLDSPGSTGATVYYRIYWRHYVQNGGQMKKNQPISLQSWDNVETYPITSQILLSEVVA